MFKIQCTRDKLICTIQEVPEGHRFIEPTQMSCEITLSLGVTPSSKAAKALTSGMDKTFNDLVKRKSGSFIKDMHSKVKALGAVIEKNGESAAKASDFLKREEADLKKLWTKWSEGLAPQLAEEALQSVVKQARESEVQSLNTRKAKAAGRVVAVPALTLASAAVSFLSGNVAGASSAALKAASALMKASDELKSALNEFNANQAAVEKDIGALASALKTIAGRINAMDKQRKSAEMEIASLKSQQRVLESELAGQRGAASQAQAQKKLKELESSVKALADNLPDTGPLKEPWKVIAAEHKKMNDAVAATGSQGPKSLRNARDLADGGKEILSILSKAT
mgnify:FL=1